MDPKSASPGAVSHILRHDRFLRVFVAAFLVEVVIYSSPLLPLASREGFGSAPFLVPFVAIAVLAAFDGLNRIAERNERRFWGCVGAGFVVWLATLLVITAIRPGHWTVLNRVLTDAAYMLFYTPLLMGLEYRPHVPGARLPRQIELSRHLRWIGLTCLFLGWFAYFVAVPIWFDPGFYQTMLPSSLLFVTADVVLIIRLVMFAAVADVARWRVIYGTLAAASLALLGTDILDAAAYTGFLYLPNGARTDLLWVAPVALFVAAVRLRNLPAGSHIHRTRRREQARDLEPERAGSLLVSAAASFPIAHVAVQSLADLSMPLQRAQDSTALLGMLAMAALAATAYYVLEQDRSTVERARDSMEERLREAGTLAAVSRLAAVTAREIDSGASAARTCVERARDALLPSHPGRDTLVQAGGALDRIDTFTRLLRAVSRQLPLRLAPHDLNEALLGLAPALHDIADDPVTLDLKLSPSAGAVLVDRDGLRQMLLPLADHARAAMPRGGILAVETDSVVLDERQAIACAARPGRYGRIRVSDSGTGISRDVLVHLFEPFFSAPDPHNGLRLAAVHAMVSQHGGIISVASDVGRGTLFELLLPAVPPHGH